MKERGARNVARRSKTADTTRFGARLLAAAYPDATISELVEIFDRRASRGTISDWRSGCQSMPQWARDILRAKLATQRAQLDAIILMIEEEKAPGKRAGARNLAIWRAANAS